MVTILSEESKVTPLQEQIDRVQKIINAVPLRMLVLGIVGTGSLSIFILLGLAFGMLWYLVGGGIFGGCVAYSHTIERSTKEEYRKLLKQLHTYISEKELQST